MKCPCCSGKTYFKCCQPYHKGKKIPASATALMRSRYSAYALAKIDYIEQTMQGKAAEGFDKADALAWARACQWQQLEVVASTIDSNDPAHAFVTFKAHYQYQGQTQLLEEQSEFRHIDGRWFYIAGVTQ